MAISQLSMLLLFVMPRILHGSRPDKACCSALYSHVSFVSSVTDAINDLAILNQFSQVLLDIMQSSWSNVVLITMYYERGISRVIRSFLVRPDLCWNLEGYTLISNSIISCTTGFVLELGRISTYTQCLLWIINRTARPSSSCYILGQLFSWDYGEINSYYSSRIHI